MDHFVRHREPSWQRERNESIGDWQERVFDQWDLAVGELPQEVQLFEPINDLLDQEPNRGELREITEEMADILDELDEDYGVDYEDGLDEDEVSEEDEDEDSWRSNPINLMKRRTWPSKEDLSDGPTTESTGSRGLLTVSRYVGDGAGWSPWRRVGVDGERDWSWPTPRFYRLLTGMRNRVGGYESPHVMFRWTPYPAGRGFAVRDAAVGNCAINILRTRFASKARDLARVAMRDDGGFGAEQMWEVSGILKRNLQIVDRAGGVMAETSRDGKWRFGESKSPVVICDYDGHALGSVPERPRVEDRHVSVLEKMWDWRELRTVYGPDAVVWPAAEGFVVAAGDLVVVLRESGVYGRIQERAEALGVEDIALQSGPFSIEVRAWRRDNRFDPTPSRLAPLWKAANLYPVPYSDFGKEAGPVADLNSAYESSPTTGARDLYERYGFPAARGQVVVKDPPMGVLAETGLVVAVLDLDRCHPWVRYQAREPRGVYTTMRLQAWVEAGAAVVVGLELAVIAWKDQPSLARPAGARYSPNRREPRWELPGPPTYDQSKHWGREAIGRLVPNGEKSQDYFYISDDAEAASVIETLRASGRLLSFEYKRVDAEREESLDDLLQDFIEPVESDDGVRGFWMIGYSDPGLPRGACYHAHAYWLDYSAVVIDREVFRHDWDKVVRVATDSITLASGEQFSGEVVFGVEPGQWKSEEVTRKSYEAPAPRAIPPLPAGGAYWRSLCRSTGGAPLLEGPPGYGKTHFCLETISGHDHVVLTPTRKMRRCMIARGLRAYTWQWALKPYGTFRPDAVRLPRDAIVYLPEIGTWSEGDVATIIPWLREQGWRVIADGDRVQMPPVKAKPPWEWLEASPGIEHIRITAGPIDGHTFRDYRSKTEGLARLKESIRGLTNRKVAAKLAGAIGETPYERFLQEWHPRDYVYTCLLEVRAGLHAALSEIHRAKYPDQPVRIRYTSGDRERSGEEEWVALGERLPPQSELAYVTTYSSCQGETASEDDSGRRPRVWITDLGASEFFPGALYTGATRVETMEQLGYVWDLPFTVSSWASPTGFDDVYAQ